MEKLTNIHDLIKKIKKNVKFNVYEFHRYEKRPLEFEFKIESKTADFLSHRFYTNDSLEKLRNDIKNLGYKGKLFSRRNNTNLQYLSEDFYSEVKEVICIDHIREGSSFCKIKFINKEGILFNVKLIKESEIVKFHKNPNYYTLFENEKKLFTLPLNLFKINCYNLIAIREYNKLKYEEYPFSDKLYENYKRKIYNEIHDAFIKLINEDSYNCSDFFGENFKIIKSESNCNVKEIKDINSVNTMGENKEDFFLNKNVKIWYLIKFFKETEKTNNLPNIEEMLAIFNKKNFHGIFFSTVY